LKDLLEERYKMKKILILLFLSLFFACQRKEPVFTLVETNKQVDTDSYQWSKYSYKNYILIENMPNDTMELKRLMIYHFLHSTSAIDSLQKNSNLNGVYCSFLKSTLGTRKRFFSLTDKEKQRAGSYTSPHGRNSLGWYNNKTYIGNVFVWRCKEDNTKLTAIIWINLGTDCDYRERLPDVEEDILLNECESDWYEKNKNDELVKYYIKLKDKKNHYQTVKLKSHLF